MEFSVDDYRVEICKNVPEFANVKPEALLFKRFTTALTNIVHSVIDPETGFGVVFRIFGSIDFGDRNLENEVCVLLGNNNVAPKIIYSTSTWRLEEFVKGDALDTVTFREIPEFQIKSMELLAKFHKIDASEVLENTEETLPWFVPTIQSEISSLDLTNNSELKKRFPTKYELIDELNWLHKTFHDLNSKLYFCHNDYRPANIIKGVDGELAAVDFDTVGYNYRGYDIGRALNAMYLNVTKEGCEWIDEAYPPEDVVQRMLVAYLKEDIGAEPSEESINQLANEVILGNLAACLHLAIWAAIKSCDGEIKWNYSRYSYDRIHQYFEAKSKHFLTILPENFNENMEF